MNKKIRKLLIIIAVAVPLLVFALMLWLASFVMTGKRQNIDEAMQWQTEHYDFSFYEKLEKTDYTIKSFE